MVTRLRATERHLSYGIIHCYLPPYTGERSVLDLPTPEGWKAELPFVVGYRDGLPVRRDLPIQVVTT